MEKKRTGRPSKGPRKRVQVRLPLELAAALEEHAEQAGLSLNDYLGEMAAQWTGVPYQDQGVLMAS
ncbi:ribbon-helix-helix protein, CopG family [Actinokineospora sp. PR83]|uniref:ribbon-helix-helix protein, CopG family n=1 Tax=Actinokineospora sp. PR83 TaxID=2884908 RepID=UPI001F465B94|nr:ribbon-helix-helix protein, CopG family [Actinokineospora sp. PR83]MCG8918266.1 ribbon-helix-helix protein, CopG family [Actinokineospora sp. PR83]